MQCVRIWGKGAPGRRNNTSRCPVVGNMLGFQGATGPRSVWPGQRGRGGKWEGEGGQRFAEDFGGLGNQFGGKCANLPARCSFSQHQPFWGPVAVSCL